jgi:hypothetical protein
MPVRVSRHESESEETERKVALAPASAAREPVYVTSWSLKSECDGESSLDVDEAKEATWAAAPAASVSAIGCDACTEGGTVGRKKPERDEQKEKMKKRERER